MSSDMRSLAELEKFELWKKLHGYTEFEGTPLVSLMKGMTKEERREYLWTTELEQDLENFYGK